MSLGRNEIRIGEVQIHPDFETGKYFRTMGIPAKQIQICQGTEKLLSGLETGTLRPRKAERMEKKLFEKARGLTQEELELVTF